MGPFSLRDGSQAAFCTAEEGGGSWGFKQSPGEGAVPPAAWTCHGYGTKVFTFAGDVQRPDWDPNRVKIDYEPRPRIVGFWKRFLMAEILLGDTGH